jgi:hypothetical protein
MVEKVRDLGACRVVDHAFPDRFRRRGYAGVAPGEGVSWIADRGKKCRQLAGSDRQGRKVRGRAFNRCLYVSCVTARARQIEWRWLTGPLSKRKRHSAQRFIGGNVSWTR